MKKINDLRQKVNDSKQKAVAIIIESLKLYTTISIGFIAVMVTLFAKGSNHVLLPCTNLYFIFAIIFFSLSAILSVSAINSLITQVYNNQIDIYDSLVRKLNLSAILSFLIGLVFGFIFIFKILAKA